MEKLRYIFDNAKVGIAICNAEDNRLEMVNPAFAAIHGYEPHELVGASPGEVFAPECMLRLAEHESSPSACSMGDVSFETTHLRKDGSLVPVSVHISVIHDEAGKVKQRIANIIDITERKRNEEHLIRTKAKLSAVISTIPDLIWVKDAQGVYLLCNPAFERFFGATCGEILGKTDYDFISREQADFFRQKDREAMEAGEMRINEEEIVFAADGRRALLETRKIPVYSGEEFMGVLGIGRDITERKKMEDDLRHKEQEFRTLTENSPDAIVRYDRNLRRAYVNPAWEKINGTGVDDVIGKTPTEKSVRIAHMAGSFETQLRHVLETGKNAEIELWWHDEKGRKIHYNMCAVAEFDLDGTVSGILTISRDVTRVKEYEEKLKQKEVRLKEAQKIAKIGSWELSFPHMALTWSDEIYRIFELEHSNLSPNYACFIDTVHPDDRQRVDSAFYESLENKTPYEIVHRLLMKDGRVKYVHERGETVYDEEGYPIRTIGTVQDITDQKAVEKKIEYMAHHDALTSLPNRTLAKERMQASIVQAKESGTKAALLFIDLDGFKTINDTLGHAVGDAMLKIVATRLKECVRATDTVARLGGDEFLVILPGIERDEDAVKVIEKMVRAFEDPFHVLHHHLSVSMSVGIAIYPDHGENFASLLQKSDTAMYKAKESGKNTYRFYDELMNHNLIGQFKIHSDLKLAVAENQLVLYYQPQIDLASNRITGAEALIRWKHPELGMIPPMEFIPLAESTGLIVPIGEWVIREACAQAARWHAQGIQISVAVNISSVQFKRGNLCSIVKNAVEGSGINPVFLELELTESIMMQETEKTLETVDELKRIGTQLSIDDFGTGYSSLAYLKRFAVDKLKIDQSFVRDILRDKEDAVIVRTIVQMAKSLNLKTIAEGVENGEVLSVIAGYGCDEVQGYHFAKPMEASEFETYHACFYGADER